MKIFTKCRAAYAGLALWVKDLMNRIGSFEQPEQSGWISPFPSCDSVVEAEIFATTGEALSFLLKRTQLIKEGRELLTLEVGSRLESLAVGWNDFCKASSAPTEAERNRLALASLWSLIFAQHRYRINEYLALALTNPKEFKLNLDKIAWHVQQLLDVFDRFMLASVTAYPSGEHDPTGKLSAILGQAPAEYVAIKLQTAVMTDGIVTTDERPEESRVGQRDDNRTDRDTLDIAARLDTLQNLLRESVVDASTATSELKEAFASLETRLRDIPTEHGERLKSARSEAAAQLARLQDEIPLLRQRLTASESAYIASESASQELRHKLKSTEGQLHRLQSEIKDWERETQKFKAEQSELFDPETIVATLVKGSAKLALPMARFLEPLLEIAMHVIRGDLEELVGHLEDVERYVYTPPETSAVLALQGVAEMIPLYQIVTLQSWLHDQLRALGIEPIYPRVGEPFNRTFHESSERDWVWSNASSATDNSVHSVLRVGFRVDSHGGVLQKARVRRIVVDSAISSRAEDESQPLGVSIVASSQRSQAGSNVAAQSPEIMKEKAVANNPEALSQSSISALKDEHKGGNEDPSEEELLMRAT